VATFEEEPRTAGERSIRAWFWRFQGVIIRCLTDRA